MAKKKFGISSSTDTALSRTMQMAKGHDSNFHNTEILISRIDLDPNNPRKHKITLNDLPDGPSNTDPDYEIKIKEYESLCELSASIIKNGLLHPIVVVKHGESYRLVAGERRFLACILAKKSQVEARVFKEKPKPLDLKVIQWVENDSRKDLSLHKKLMNVAAVIDAYRSTSDAKFTAIKLSELLAISRQLAQFYVAILNNKSLMKLIEKGDITSFRKARELAKYKTEAEILAAFQSSNELKSDNAKKPLKEKSKSRASNTSNKVVLGTTKNMNAAKEIMSCILSSKKFKKFKDDFSDTNWDDVKHTSDAFTKLIKLIENEV